MYKSMLLIPGGRYEIDINFKAGCSVLYSEETFFAWS